MIYNGKDCSNVIVTIDHLKAAKMYTPDNRGYCVPGMRLFAKANNLDFKKFITKGLPASDFKDLVDDDMVKHLLNEAVK